MNQHNRNRDPNKHFVTFAEVVGADGTSTLYPISAVQKIWHSTDGNTAALFYKDSDGYYSEHTVDLSDGGSIDIVRWSIGRTI